MKHPTIAIVGRPNVGKSSLFNILTRSRSAIVDDFAGVTCDRHYGHATHNDQPYIIVDTGGFSEETTHPLQEALNEQVQLAIHEADVVLFVVDVKAGVCSTDLNIVQHLRSHAQDVIIVVNKAEGLDQETAINEFYQLGYANMCAISASHRHGIAHIWDCIEARPKQPKKTEIDPEELGIQLAIVGRPNVGKSTLVNHLLGTNQVIVSDIPGTTRDSIHVPIDYKKQRYTLIDTAGLRRKSRIAAKTVERYSVLRTLDSIMTADVVLLLVDATEGLSDQDCKLIQYIEDLGRAFTIGLNKWDMLDQVQKKHVRDHLEFRLRNIDYVDVHTFSALKGFGIDKIFGSVQQCYRATHQDMTTHQLTSLLLEAAEQHPPPMKNGRRIRLRYAHPAGNKPPHIIIHGKQTSALSGAYKKYLERHFRQALRLHGAPIQLTFKNDHNPYSKTR